MTSSADHVLARELATEATFLHLSDQHDAALQTLQRLEGLLPDDLAVQQNLVLSEWCADADLSIDSLAQHLEQLLKETKIQSHENSVPASSTIAALNQAAILYSKQQHATALSILQPLCPRVEVMHDEAALCLCILLLEIYLCSNQHAKAAQALHCLQESTAPAVKLRKAVAVEQSDTLAQEIVSYVNEHQQQPLSPGPVHQQLATAPCSNQQQLSSSQALQHQERHSHTVMPEQQHKQEGDQAKDAPAAVAINLPRVSWLTSPLMQQVQQLMEKQGDVVLGVDVPALLHLYKARLALACHNHKVAKKEVRALLALQCENSAGVLLKAEVEVLRQQPRKAIKTLSPLLSGSAHQTARARRQLLNLLASIHQQLGKHHVASLYLSAALSQHQAYNIQQQQQQQIQPTAKHKQQPKQQSKHKQLLESQPPYDQQRKPAAVETQQQQQAVLGDSAAECGIRGHCLPSDESDALHYNMGLQQLLLNNWQAALESFEAASSKYYSSCGLWLRLAEATLSVYQQQQQQQQQYPQQQPKQSSSRQCGATAAPYDSSNGHEHPDGVSLLQQAAQQLDTGLALLQEQQAEAAKQAEADAAAMSAAAATIEDCGSLEATANSCLRTGLQNVGHDATVHNGPSDLAMQALATDSTPVSMAMVSLPHNSSSRVGTADAAMHVNTGNLFGTFALSPELPAIHQALLANQAYVQLLMQKPSEALAAAQALLACSIGHPHYNYLGNCYAAEALLLLGKHEEAAEQLQGYLAQSVHDSSGGSEAGAADGAVTGSAVVFGTEGRSVQQKSSRSRAAGHNDIPAESNVGSDNTSSATQMQAVVLANLSSVRAAQGDAEGSRACAAAAAAADAGICESSEVLLLSVPAETRIKGDSA